MRPRPGNHFPAGTPPEPRERRRYGHSAAGADTNVWLDWLVFDDRGVSHLRAAAAAGAVTIWIDEPCSAELARVLGYPLLGASLPESEQAAHLAAALRIAHRYERAGAPPASPLPVCRDPDDQKFLELARDCKAHALLTRDNALLELARHRQRPLPFRVLRPADPAAPAMPGHAR